MKSKTLLIAFIAILFSLLSCKTSNIQESNSPVIETVSSDCNDAIEIFNSAAAGNIKNQIEAANSKYSRIPEDLKLLYPKARDAWNKELSNLKYNYSSDYKTISLQPLTIQLNTDWKSQSLEDYQVFFLLLAEYSYGKYPSESKDTLKKLAWIEKADSKKRMESIVKHTIQNNCRSNDEVIRTLINPILLPDTIEDCLKKL